MLKPTGTPVSLAVAAGIASRHIVWVHCPACPALPNDHWPHWLLACHRLTPQLQRFGPDTALLDLGVCKDTEAFAAVSALLTRMQRQQITLRAAIASSGILAQLALLHAPADEPLILLTTAQTGDLLRRTPIAALSRLQFADLTVIPAEIVAKLDSYGIHTLAQLARLEEGSLRRQFGARLGLLLAAVAQGADPLPFQPTPAPLRLPFRLRLAEPLAPDRLLAGLGPLALDAAAALARRGLQGQTLELRLRWETGTVERRTRTLPQSIHRARALEEAARRLLIPVFQNHRHPEHALCAVEAFQLTITQLTPCYPAQHSFWPPRARRLTTAQELATVLARRYGKPLLFHSLSTAPDAIFDQDRSRLAPFAADVTHAANGADDQQDRARGPMRPAASGDITAIPHGIRWW